MRTKKLNLKTPFLHSSLLPRLNFTCHFLYLLHPNGREIGNGGLWVNSHILCYLLLSSSAWSTSSPPSSWPFLPHILTPFFPDCNCHSLFNCYPRGAATIAEGLSLGQCCVHPGARWHWIHQTQGKLVAPSHRSHPYIQRIYKNLAMQMQHKTLWRTSWNENPWQHGPSFCSYVKLHIVEGRSLENLSLGCQQHWLNSSLPTTDSGIQHWIHSDSSKYYQSTYTALILFECLDQSYPFPKRFVHLDSRSFPN